MTDDKNTSPVSSLSGDDLALVERLDSHMGLADMQEVLRDCRAAVKLIRSLATKATPAPSLSGKDRGFMPKFALGDRVRKRSGSSWQGRVVGFYTTALTPNGYAVESEREPGSVQIYPEAALENADV